MPEDVAVLTERKLSGSLGVNRSLVGRKRRQGKTDDQILEEASKASEKAVANGSVETYSQAQARKETSLADLRELELKEKRGELISMADVEAQWSELAVNLRDGIRGISARVANRLPAEWRREIVAVIDDEARQLLTALSDEISAIAAVD